MAKLACRHEPKLFGWIKLQRTEALELKLAFVVLVRDEADIIRHTLDYHLEAGVDFIVAIDNGSQDGTREILEEYVRANVATVIDEPGRDFMQFKWMTDAAHFARDTLGADWLICSDADEFWVATNGSLKATIKAKRADILSCRRRNMLCSIEALKTGDWQRELVHYATPPIQPPELRDFYRDPLPGPHLYFNLPPKVIVRADGLKEIAQGNHFASYNRPTTAVEAELVVYHYPVRSLEAFEQKIVQGGRAYAENAVLPEHVGWHWRRWFRLYSRQGLEDVLAEAIPDAGTLAADFAAGRVSKGQSFHELFANLRREDLTDSMLLRE